MAGPFVDALDPYAGDELTAQLNAANADPSLSARGCASSSRTPGAAHCRRCSPRRSSCRAGICRTAGPCLCGAPRSIQRAFTDTHVARHVAQAARI